MGMELLEGEVSGSVSGPALALDSEPDSALEGGISHRHYLYIAQGA
jgi:hypothetical protein